MKPYRDQFGVWNVEGKPVTRDSLPAAFRAEVEAKVNRSTGVGGWSKGPAFILDEAQDEAIDLPAWLRGLDLFDMPDGAADLIGEIGLDAAAIYRKLERLKGLYE